MNPNEITALVDVILERTKEGKLAWYYTDKELKCEAAGAAFILTTSEGDGAWWKGALSIFDGEVLLLRCYSNRSYTIVSIYIKAQEYANSIANSRLKEILSCLNIEKAPATNNLEINREE